jgi:hypothetical protein
MTLTPEEITEWKHKIDRMNQRACAQLQRFAPAGHVVFTDSELYEYFNVHFRSLGGMTPKISKEIGWDPPK